MKQQLELLNNWYNSLSLRDRNLLITTIIFLSITLFYLIVWEPVHQGRDLQQQKLKSQQDIYTWMQSASNEVKSLKSSGIRKATSNQPISLILENSANSASFDQLLVWLNTLEQQHGVTITTANIERNEKMGTVSARLSFEKIQ